MSLLHPDVSLMCRSIEAFENHFGDLTPIVEFQRSLYARNASKELKAKMKKLFQNEASSKEMVQAIKVLIWTPIVDSCDEIRS